MTTPRNIRANLNQLGDRAPVQSQGHRSISTVDGPAAILREIDQTVLKRRLFLGNGRGGEITLDASGRRLQYLRAVNIPGASRPYATLCNQPIDESAVDDIMDLFELLSLFTDGSDTLDVITERHSSDDWDTEIGVSAGQLAEVWMLELYPDSTQKRPKPKSRPLSRPLSRPIAPAEAPQPPVDLSTPIPGFLQSCDGLFSAAILLEGDVATARIGGPEDLAHLDGLSAHRTAPLGLSAGLVDPSPDTPYFGLIRNDARQGNLLAIAGRGDDSLLLMAPANNMPKISALWQLAS